jgi:hypothetical protein
MTSRTDKMFAGNSRAAYMREYRKTKRSEEDNCNNVPKRKTLHAERQSEYKETDKNLSAEYTRFQRYIFSFYVIFFTHFLPYSCYMSH